MTDATWLPVPGFEDRYDVSDRGEVRSRYSGKPRLLHPALNPRGYVVAYLCRDGAMHRMTVHRLVALAFLGPRPPGMEIRHLDGNRQNNALSNLAYGSGSDNSLDAVRHGTHTQARKTHCPQGHPYDAANTYIRPGTKHRTCRECSRARARIYKAKRQRVS